MVPRPVPNSASTPLERKFCDFQPIVLKASVMPTDVPLVGLFLGDVDLVADATMRVE